MKSNALAFAAKELHCQEQDLEIAEINTIFFRNWHFWRVSNDILPPDSLILTTHQNAVEKVRFEDGFALQSASDPVNLSNPDVAIEYTKFFLSVADPMMDILRSIDDVPGATSQEKQKWRGHVKRPSAHTHGHGYEVEAWLWKHNQLMQGVFLIAADGKIHSEIKVIAQKVGVEITLE